MDGISIIIPCYNSEKRIAKTLEHIRLQQIPAHLNWEVILVDNASTDRTVEIAKQEWRKNNVTNTKLTIVKESRQGSMFARLTGVKASTYSILLFCDDDNWLAENYAQEAFRIFSIDPLIGIAGGLNLPVYESIPEDWIYEVEEFLAIGPHSMQMEEGDITETHGFVYGAGMVVRKEIYDRLGQLQFQQLCIGREGSSLIGGEDSELCFLSRILGFRIYFSKRLTLKHFIPSSRTTKPYFRKLMYGMGKSSIYLSPYYYKLNDIELSGIERIKIKWQWQILSTVKAFLLVLYSKKSANEKEFKKEELKGRMAGLFAERKKLAKMYKQIETIVK